MNPDNELLLPNLVPVENRLILSPEAERERQLALIEELEAEQGDLAEPDELELRDRAVHGVCRRCGHRKLLFKPAMLCEKDLRQAAEDAGLAMPPARQLRPANRAERRRAARKRK